MKGDPDTDAANFFIGYFHELKVDVAPIQTSRLKEEFGIPDEVTLPFEHSNSLSVLVDQSEITKDEW